MLEKLYLIMGCLELFIVFIAVSKYIYFEKFPYQTRTWYFILGTLLFSETLVFLLNKDGNPIQLALPFLFFSILVFFSRKKHKVAGLFLIVPITGIIFSIFIIPISFQYLFSKSMNTIIDTDTPWMGIFDIVFWIILILFFWKGGKRRRRFENIVQNRTLSRWERNLVNVTGLFLLLFSTSIICVDEMKIESIYAKFFVGFGIIVMFFLETSIIALVVQGNGKAYFQQAAILNEYYLNSQLDHFKTYQETQRETRRVYHDMKNHMTCLYHLISEGSNEEAGKYILELNNQIQQIDKELHTGNDIVDAILNVKKASAEKDQISFSIEGKLGALKIDAIDLCTIFANAIDNAMEALKDSSNSERELQIHFKQQQSMQLFLFRNPVSTRQSTSSFSTTKKDYINHGFGLENIRIAVEKYNGQMNYYLENDGEHSFFVLEILLFAQSAT